MGRLLFFCAPEFGHLNLSIAIAKAVLDADDTHEVFFIVDDFWQSKLTAIDARFKSVLLENPPPPPTDDGREGVPVPIQLIELTKPYGSLDRAARNELFCRLLIKILDFCESIEGQLNNIVESTKPDLIMVDHIGLQPTLINKGIPWCHVYSVVLNIFRHTDMPPPLVQAKSLDRRTWPDKSIEYERVFGTLLNKHRRWMQRHNIRLPAEDSLYHESPYFNVYLSSRQMDYNVDLPGLWYRVPIPMVEPSSKALELPKKFTKKEGQLIYFSLGSFLSLNVELMQRLIDILGKLPHKFLISGGMFMEQFKVPDNCLVQSFVDQHTVLKNVKVMITHCGNNTTSECFYYGVKMIPMPVYGDQHENAIRMHELGYSVEPMDPFTVTLEQLDKAIKDTFELDIRTAEDPRLAAHQFREVVNVVLKYLTKETEEEQARKLLQGQI